MTRLNPISSLNQSLSWVSSFSSASVTTLTVPRYLLLVVGPSAPSTSTPPFRCLVILVSPPLAPFDAVRLPEDLSSTPFRSISAAMGTGNEPFNCFRDWPLTESLREYLVESGCGFVIPVYDYFSDEKVTLSKDNKLLSEVAESYVSNTGCFEKNGVKLFFGLVEVYLFTGMPIEGQPVMGVVKNSYVEEANEAFDNETYKEFMPGDLPHKCFRKTARLC